MNDPLSDVRREELINHAVLRWETEALRFKGQRDAARQDARQALVENERLHAQHEADQQEIERLRALARRALALSERLRALARRALALSERPRSNEAWFAEREEIKEALR